MLRKDTMIAQLSARLSKRKLIGNLRALQIVDHLVDFSSNDYLGLARSPELAKTLKQEWNHCPPPYNGLGSTGSRLLSGNSHYAEELENRLALFHGYEAGLMFNCGYMANLGLLSTVAGSGDAIFFDTAVHASTRDGIRLSRAQAFPFRHNDVDHLEKRLRNFCKNGQRFVCIESLYSTDGSKAPLREIYQMTQRYEAHLIVDEAHAVGVCGPQGRGLVAEQLPHHAAFAQVTTFGKALGVHGAIVLGSHTLKQALINFATPAIYTTAMPFHSLAAITCTYDLFPTLDSARQHLQNLIHLLSKAGLDSSGTHIQPVRFKGNQRVKRAAAFLQEQGFDVRSLMSPTVKRGEETLRICLHAFNSEEQLTQLVQAIKNAKSYSYV